MGDRDTLHLALGKFRPVYLQICEGTFEPQEHAYEVARVLKEQVMNYGDPPLKLIDTVCDSLEGKFSSVESVLDLVDGEEPYDLVNSATVQTMGHPDGVELARLACLEQLQDRHDASSLDGFRHEVKVKYLRRVLKSKFIGRVDSITEDAQSSASEFHEKLQKVLPYIETHLEHLAEQLDRSGTVQSMQMSSRERVRKVDILETDLEKAW